jgi:hypothetical protein
MVILARTLGKAWFPWVSQQCLDTVAVPARLRKHPIGLVPLSHPLAVQFTPEQMAWLDSRCIGGLSRSAVIRLIIEEAMRREQEQRK